MEQPLNLLGLIKLVSQDIEDCLDTADQLIGLGLEPWRTLQTATALDDLRRRYIREAIADGATVLMVSGVAMLSPNAIREILKQQVSQA
jgi:hypothetical protein